jgi:Zn ribbon nucleic-acid-binding protein
MDRGRGLIMGDRYIFTVDCLKCGFHDDDAYYAPSCGFTTWRCLECGYRAEILDTIHLGHEVKEDEDGTDV